LCDYTKLREAIPDSIVVIQDAAESFPGHPKNETTGIQGDVTTFSFYANKVITSGEGGAILASKSRIQKIDRIKSQNLEQVGTFKHAGIGYNYRITNLQAAVFRGQWIRRKRFMRRRLWVFNTYAKFLSGHEFLLNSNLSDNPWLVTLQLKITGKQMNLLAKNLKNKGIETRRCFTPASEHDYVRAESICSGELIKSKQLSDQIISFPTYPSLSKKKIKYIVETLIVEYEKVSKN
jgi:perosamine synthetase